MTPQLMQAIKLLALSNLDLAAYVEGELERNPLLERIEDGEPERASSDRAGTPAADASSPDWADPGAEADRAGVNVRAVAGLDDTGAGRCRRRDLALQCRDCAGKCRMVRHRQRSKRRLQSGSVRLGRAYARRSLCRAARIHDRGSRSSHDRSISDRSRRRHRLPQRGCRCDQRSARCPAERSRSRPGDPERVRPRGRVRAQSPGMPRPPAQGTRSLRSRDGAIGRSSRSAGEARFRRLAQTLRHQRRGSCRHDR